VPADAVIEALSDVAVNLAEARQIAPCKACRSTGWRDDAPCVSVSAEIVGDHEWSTCPYGMMVAPWWQSVLWLDAVAMVSPVQGWPLDFGHGIVQGLLSLRGARMRAEVAAAKRAQSAARAR
jgi:hypothetical protein